MDIQIIDRQAALRQLVADMAADDGQLRGRQLHLTLGILHGALSLPSNREQLARDIRDGKVSGRYLESVRDALDTILLASTPKES